MSSKRQPRPNNDAAELLPLPDAGDQISAFFDSLGPDGSAAVSIYAVDPKNRLTRSFLFTLPDATDLSGPELMAQVLEKHGAGEYMADSRDEKGQIVFSARFRVGPLGASRPIVPDPTPATPSSRPGDTSPLEAILARQTQLLELLLARQTQAPSMLGMLKELKELRDVIAPPVAAPAFDLGKVLELVNGVVTLRDTLGDQGGGGDGGGPLGILARGLVPALQKIAERAVDTPAQLPAPATAAAPAPGVTDSPAPASPAAEGDDVRGNGLMLKGYVAELVAYAEQGAEPRAAADQVLRQLATLPESFVEPVVNWLNDEQVVDNLAELDPRVRNYAQWFSQVVDAVLDAVLEPEQPAPTPPANGQAQPAAGG